MTFQISQRGKEYLKTAEILLRAAQTMTDRAIGVSLRPLPTISSGEQRKPRMLMRPKHSLDRLLTLKASGVHDLMGSITAQPAEEMRGEHWDVARGRSRAFYSFVTACGLEGWSRYPRSRWNDYRHLMADSFSNCGPLL